MRNITNAAASLLRTLTEDGNLCPRRLSQSRQSAQERSLPCSVFAKNGVEASRVKLCRDAAQRGKMSKLLDNVADGDDGSALRRSCHGIHRAGKAIRICC